MRLGYFDALLAAVPSLLIGDCSRGKVLTGGSVFVTVHHSGVEDAAKNDAMWRVPMLTVLFFHGIQLIIAYFMVQ